jgi:hypothetical protein
MTLPDTAKTIWRDVTAQNPLELVSPLARDDVVRRLQAAVDSEWTFAGRKEAVGHVTADALRLRARIFYRNSFQTFLFGKLVAEGRRTRLVVRTGMHPLAALFMALWLAAVGAFAFVGLSAAVEPADAAEAGLLFLVPLAMFGFGIALVGIGRWIARNERQRLIDFLARTVEARASEGSRKRLP